MVASRKTIQTSGLAATRQRVLILKFIQGRTDHPDAETVHQDVSCAMPSISLDTVYRALSLFVRKGLIQQLAVPTRRSRYDGHVAPHDHFLCTRCERIEDVPGDTSPLPEDVAKVGTVQSTQRTYLGLCHACAEHEGAFAGRG